MAQAIALTDDEQRVFERTVKDFDRVYANVTAAIEARLAEQRSDGSLTEREHEWVKYLIANFQAHYHSWPTEPTLADYLRVFLERGSLSRPLRRLFNLAGFVYLHVAHDLALVIAPSLKQYCLSSPPHLSPARARSIYLSLGPAFAASFLNSQRSGTLGLWVKVRSFLPGVRSLATVTSYWVLTLRSIAFLHAENLCESTDVEALRLGLRSAVLAAAKRAGERYSILGLPFEPPELALLAALPTLGAWMAHTRALPLALFVAVLLLFLWLEVYCRYQASALDFLGNCLVEELSKQTSAHESRDEKLLR